MSELKVHASACDIEPMVQIEDIRIAFTQRLKQSLAAKGIDQWGAGVRLAKIAAVTPKAASKWLNGESMPGAAKMHAIAEALGVKVEWLQHGAGDAPPLVAHFNEGDSATDAPTSAADIVRLMIDRHGKNLPDQARRRIVEAVSTDPGAAPSSNILLGDFSGPGQVGDEIRIAHYDIRAAMGGGQIPADYPEILQDVKVSQQHLREMGVSYTDPFHLKMVTGWGQSMEPTIRHRDPLLVDVSIREFVDDGIYLLTWDDHLYIKRLQVADEDHFEMISDNAKHKPRLIRRDATFIQARVLLVWNAHLL